MALGSRIILVKSGKFNSFCFDEVYDLFFDELVIFGLSFTRNREDVEDAIQEVFVKLIDNKRKFESLQKLKSYVFVSVKHCIFNKIESKNSKTKYHNNRSFIIDNISSIEDCIIESEIKKEVMNSYNMLPFRCKQIFNLHLNGFSVKQISEELDISENTIKTQKKIALKILREKISSDIFVFILTQKYPSGK